MLRAFQVADYIVADCVGKLLRREQKSHPSRPLWREKRHEVSILSRHRGRRNLGNIFRVIGLTGMRQPILRSTNRAHKRCDGAQLCRGTGCVGAIFHCLSVSFATMALRSH